MDVVENGGRAVRPEVAVGVLGVCGSVAAEFRGTALRTGVDGGRDMVKDVGGIQQESDNVRRLLCSEDVNPVQTGFGSEDGSRHVTCTILAAPSRAWYLT